MKNIKSTLKNLNNHQADRALLTSFRGELDYFIKARPIEQPGLFVLFTKTATVLGLVIVLVMSGGGLVYASKDSLPGQRLYPVKIATEEARLTIAIKPAKRKELQIKFINKRISEVAVISKEKNINNNAQTALVIIDKKIHEIENLENEDKKTEDEENITEEKILSKASSSATSTSHATNSRESNGDEIEINKPQQAVKRQSAKQRRESIKNTKERLKESHAILERLIRINTEEHIRQKNDKNKGTEKKSEKLQATEIKKIRKIASSTIEQTAEIKKEIELQREKRRKAETSNKRQEKPQEYIPSSESKENLP